MSIEQQKSIEKVLTESEITYSHLFDDLLDHVCCDIETLMERGIQYEDAYNKVFDNIGLNGLKEIQEATIFYVKFNLLVMKKFMNAMAIIGTTILTGGLIFKMMHWPGANVLFLLGFLFLFLGFYPTAFLNIRKELQVGVFSKSFLIYIVGFMALIFTGVAIIFTAMHWPGGTIIMLISWVLLMCIFFPFLFYVLIKTSKNRITNLSIAIFVFIFFAVSIVNTYNGRIKGANVYEYSMLERDNIFYEGKINEILAGDVNLNTDVEELNTLRKQIEVLISKLQHGILNDKPNIYEVAVSIGHRGTYIENYDNSVRELKKLIQQYTNKVNKLIADTETRQYLTKKLSVEPWKLKVYGKISWERRNFYGSSGLAGRYTNLERLLRDIRQAHFQVLHAQQQQRIIIAPEL